MGTLLLHDKQILFLLIILINFQPSATQKFLVGILNSNTYFPNEQLVQLTQSTQNTAGVHLTHIIRDTWLNIQPFVPHYNKEQGTSMVPSQKSLFSYPQFIGARNIAKDHPNTMFFLGLSEYFSEIFLDPASFGLGNWTPDEYIQQIREFVIETGYEGIHISISKKYIAESNTDPNHPKEALTRLYRAINYLSGKEKFPQPVNEPANTIKDKGQPILVSLSLNSNLAGLNNKNEAAQYLKGITDISAFVLVTADEEFERNTAKDRHDPLHRKYDIRSVDGEGQRFLGQQAIDKYFEDLIKHGVPAEKLVLYTASSVYLNDSGEKYSVLSMENFCSMNYEKKEGQEQWVKEYDHIATNMGQLSGRHFEISLNSKLYQVRYNLLEKAALIGKYKGIALNIDEIRDCSGKRPFVIFPKLQSWFSNRPQGY